jgi:hypothetical protein
VDNGTAIFSLRASIQCGTVLVRVKINTNASVAMEDRRHALITRDTLVRDVNGYSA